jgi:hypothetical protein
VPPLCVASCWNIVPKATGFATVATLKLQLYRVFQPYKLNIGDADTAEAFSCTGSYTRAEACSIACDAEDLGALSTISTGYLPL